MALKRCPGCGKLQPNVGPWKEPGEPPELCGICKFRRSMRRPGMKERLEKEASRMAGVRVKIEVEEEPN